MSKTAIITGGSGGIGSAICRVLAAEGWRTVVCYNHGEAQAKALAAELCAGGHTAQAFFMDISSKVSIEGGLAKIKTILGEPELLVNNAGIADIGLFTDMTDERLCEMLNVNLLGTMRLSKAVLPEMIRAHRGNIVNISSVWGEVGASCEVAYSAAKAGLIGFTKALAREVAVSGVKVNCISCGMIDTKMNGELSPEDVQAVVDEISVGRIGTPKDVANAVKFLASDQSDYIHGQVIRVDGAWI